MIHRRGLLTGLAATLAAPAIVRADVLMRISPDRCWSRITVLGEDGRLLELVVLSPGRLSPADMMLYDRYVARKWGTDQIVRWDRITIPRQWGQFGTEAVGRRIEVLERARLAIERARA